MPIDLAVPLRPRPAASLVMPTTVVFLGKVLLLVLASGLWVGIQCVYLGAQPTEAQETIAGP